MTGDPIVFATVFIALYVAHSVGDHWIQTHHQALDKGKPSWTGRLACARHVTTLTLTKALLSTLAVAVLGLHLNPWAATGALLLDAASHYWADRRFTLKKLAHRVGKGEFTDLGDGLASPCGTGAYALDQSWHHAWLFIAALIASLGGA